MPILPSGGSRWIDANGASAATVRPLVLRATSPGIYELKTTGRADLELVDVTAAGVFEAVAVGTAPTADRIVARSIAGANILVY